MKIKMIQDQDQTMFIYIIVGSLHYMGKFNRNAVSQLRANCPMTVAIQTLTEESLQQDIFDLGESPPPKPKKKSLGGRDAFVEALSYDKILQSQQWQRNRMVVEVRMTNRFSSLLSQL